MNIVSTFLVLVFSGLIAACSPITEKDLAELQSPNDAVKKEAIQKFATGERFPVSLVEPSWFVPFGALVLASHTDSHQTTFAGGSSICPWGWIPVGSMPICIW